MYKRSSLRYAAVFIISSHTFAARAWSSAPPHAAREFCSARLLQREVAPPARQVAVVGSNSSVACARGCVRSRVAPSERVVFTPASTEWQRTRTLARTSSPSLTT